MKESRERVKRRPHTELGESLPFQELEEKEEKSREGSDGTHPGPGVRHRQMETKDGWWKLSPKAGNLTSYFSSSLFSYSPHVFPGLVSLYLLAQMS